MKFSHRLIMILVLLLPGPQLFAQEMTEDAKSVRAIVSGIVSYTRWPALSGQPTLCIFSSSQFTRTLADNNNTSLPYLPVIIHSEQEALTTRCDGFYFGSESPEYQVTLANTYPSKALLLIAEQNTDCIIGSAFCLIIHDHKESVDKLSDFVSHWLFPVPVAQPVWHDGKIIGEVRLTARDSLISHFIWLSLGVLTGSILLASFIAIILSRHLHNGVVEALQNITDVVHDVRTNRNFSRRVSEERIEEFHHFAQDFNSLLDEMEEWQLRLQAKNAQLLRTTLHDPLTGLANRAAFRSSINALMTDSTARSCTALLFLDGDNFKHVNDTWGHATGDLVLIEVARRMAEFGGKRHQPYRLGGDEFAMVLYDVHSEHEVQRICSALSRVFTRPFDLHNGHLTNMTLSIGYALAWEHSSAEKLQELADRNMYLAKHQRRALE